jgi:hypothetical protein
MRKRQALRQNLSLKIVVKWNAMSNKKCSPTCSAKNNVTVWQDKAWANRFRLWCGRGAMIPTNLGMMLAVIVAIFVLVLGILDLKHQYFRQQQILERLGI